MKPNKESCMLCDIQYVKPNKKENLPDYLYIIWKDLKTREKYVEAIPEPRMDIFFEKPEFRDHNYVKNYAHLKDVERKTVKYKDIVYAIAEDMGETGRNKLNELFNTHNYNEIKNFYLYPYVYGADFDIRSFYRIKWLQNFDNNMTKKLDKGFLDIEVDGLEVPGIPTPQQCPINAITLIDQTNMQVYTFALTHIPCVEKPTQNMSERDYKKEVERREMYQNMYNQQDELIKHIPEFKQKLHDMFDESYPGLEYNIYFYTEEEKLLIHFFQLVNKLKLDMIGIWNMGFDIPYIKERLEYLGLDPSLIMCHPDFPSKMCYYKKDTKNFEIKKKSDFFNLSSYTLFYDQMILYAGIRKGGQELRSYKLNFIAKKELKDEKLDYSEDGDIKTLPYKNWELFLIYNIKDVLLQYGIEQRTTDFDTLYSYSYPNATSYDSVFKQTIKLRNVQYLSFLDQGLIPGENINVSNYQPVQITDNEDEEDDKFEGALVANPLYNDYVGMDLFGKRTNNVFANAIDMDMSAFYPSSIFAMNIDPSTLIFKTILPISQFNVKSRFNPKGGSLPINGITNKNISEEKNDDIAKEALDNFQTGNYMTTAHKWMNFPSIDEIYKEVKKKLG